MHGRRWRDRGRIARTIRCMCAVAGETPCTGASVPARAIRLSVWGRRGFGPRWALCRLRCGSNRSRARSESRRTPGQCGRAGADEVRAAGVGYADGVEMPGHVGEAAKTCHSAWDIGAVSTANAPDSDKGGAAVRPSTRPGAGRSAARAVVRRRPGGGRGTFGAALPAYRGAARTIAAMLLRRAFLRPSFSWRSGRSTRTSRAARPVRTLRKVKARAGVVRYSRWRHGLRGGG